MPRTNNRNKVQVHLSNAFGVGSSRTQSKRNRNEYFAHAPKSIYPALALAMGR